MTHVDILTVTCPTNKSPHEYIQQYDGTLKGLKAEIERACEEIGLDVSEADINTIHKKLLRDGIYWFDSHGQDYSYSDYCFEKFRL